MSVRSLTERVSDLEFEVKSLKSQIDCLVAEFEIFQKLCVTVFKDQGYKISRENDAGLDS